MEGRELPPEPWSRLEGMGKWIGLMVPRLCDPVLAVRKAAVECIEQVFFFFVWLFAIFFFLNFYFKVVVCESCPSLVQGESECCGG